MPANLGRHPRDILFQGEKRVPIIPACEHFAGSEKLITKALSIQRDAPRAFDVTLDLEDGAAQGHERSHAEMVVDILRMLDMGKRRVGVRVHGVHHPHWKADVDIVVRAARAKIAYLTIPKVQRAGEVREVIAHVAQIANAEIPLHVLIETHGALREVFEIASIPSVETLDFGLMDFISDHHAAIDASCMRSPGQFEHALLRRAKSEIAAAALANGVVPSHNVTIDFKEPERAKTDAIRARGEFGFLRMWSIHPDQIEPILDAMAPDFSEVVRASRVLLEAQKKDWAPIAHEGRLYDRASYRLDWALIERAHVAGAYLGDEIHDAFFTELGEPRPAMV